MRKWFWVLHCVDSDSLIGDNNDAKYFHKWYVPVPMFETIDGIGKCCTLSFGNILWILAVRKICKNKNQKINVQINVWQ